MKSLRPFDWDDEIYINDSKCKTFEEKVAEALDKKAVEE